MDTTVATVVRFRTALAGFHKTDVTNYISQSARANRDVINELNQQIHALQEENTALRANAMDGAYVAELEQKATALAELEQENGLLRNRVRQLEYKLEEALAVPAEEPVQEEAVQEESVQEEAVQEEASVENLMELELAAYRRAEEMERRVSQRTRALASQLDGIAQNSTLQFGITVDSARGILAAIEDQLQILQSASDELKQAMANSMEQMKAFVALLPEADEAEGE